ncbi:GTP-binding protein LepA [Thermosipho melanesiensis]|uniref:Elongation factor 4 n=2 Tax=Thermosipho melanesiensis TaxID=46541 RepID=A6LJK6_THEM4|nr:translation elongation factor 4 [Thermosipho melanesiensis]ABR30107.1 GTP-binding protein LepA [Thermosipho melanesiensis BI429]APT73304.1 GTP-binding protein LepA [Thermosipho melanesiensis]OOC38695.1 GTP-binding protein LepA [Thermosipho melanesiensis]OOC40499.1 GTP-binding protein LepA [Thermosipho melanesiensis]OOC40764.1 GTP-binding protein LepA [Thermosipho melanesiensis]
MKNVRNISIIAHIDHGKTTLSDRILEITGAVEKRKMREQFLDSMDIERERGITIKSHPLRVFYKSKKNGKVYEINIVDTPGHVDFTYEVDRSLAAVEGVILLVDASQGVQAQTVANAYKAIEHNLEIIPVINKIDLPNANIPETELEIEDLIGISSEEILKVSAKEGIGVEDVLEAIIGRVPSPKGTENEKLSALIFDAKYDKYRGVITYVRVFNGEIKPGDKIMTYSNKQVYEVVETGVFTPDMTPIEKLKAGDIGYIIAGIKEVSLAKIGDTITNATDPVEEPLPGYKEIKPMVFAGMYPGVPEYYEELRKALEKLKLNDSSLTFYPDHSPALGFGFRCGFLGLLHMDVVRERLEREFEMTVILTAPNVEYKVILKNGEEVIVNDPAKFPDESMIQEVYEPYVKLSIITPPEYLGKLMNLVQNEKRGIMTSTENAGFERVVLNFEVPLAEIIFDFFDKMKASSRGYASMDYEMIGYRKSELVKITILVNKEPVDALSIIAHKNKAYAMARKLVDKLAELIPQHQFEIPVQARAGGRIIARSTIKALRKDVLAKCYGGDVTRKMKLLQKQKEGKKRLREIGSVSIPQEAFLALLKVGEDENK